MVLMNDEDIVLPGFMNDEDIVLPGFMNDEDIVLPGFVNRRRHCSSGIYEPTEAPFIRKVDVLVNPAENKVYRVERVDGSYERRGRRSS